MRLYAILALLLCLFIVYGWVASWKYRKIPPSGRRGR